MEEQRVNRIAVLISEDDATISLYRTNQKLGEVSNYDLGIPSYEDSGLPNKNLYMSYCKDFIINLLENGGIQGFYYEPKQEEENSDKPRRFDTGIFSSVATKQVSDILSNMFEDTQISLQSCSYGQVDVTERYLDKFIRCGKINIICSISNQTKKATISVMVEIRSGQLCKPKVMLYDGQEFKFNVTSIKSLLK